MRTLTLIVLCVAALACTTARAGRLVRRAAACRPRQPAPAAPFYAAPAVVRPVQSPSPLVGAGSEAAVLQLINGWRAARGRGPLSWDAGLAAHAAANSGTHSALAAGASQCWAGCPDPVQAARMWIGSPAHAAILLNATTAIGVSRCPSGVTCNVR